MEYAYAYQFANRGQFKPRNRTIDADTPGRAAEEAKNRYEAEAPGGAAEWSSPTNPVESIILIPRGEDVFGLRQPPGTYDFDTLAPR